MLEQFFLRPATVDRIHASWIGGAIEHYVTWLAENDYATRNVFSRVPILVKFGIFTSEKGAKDWNELPSYVESFVEVWLIEHGKEEASALKRNEAARAIRNPIQQMLNLIIPVGRLSSVRHELPVPFLDGVPDFFTFLRRDRGLREATIVQYQHYLRRLESFLRNIKMQTLSELSPAVVNAFITESGQRVDKRSVQSLCSILKVFLRYLYRIGIHTRDLSRIIESPRSYRLAKIPRSISWASVQQMLEAVDRRNAAGKRDYAMLLLLVAYGLRAREVAALTLDDLDWKRERLYIRARKAGHSSVYPLSSVVGEGILDYLQRGRPKTDERRLFLRIPAPHRPVAWHVVSSRAKHYLCKAGIEVPRPGSHTLRHSCVQRLVEARFSFKTIGDYVGHRTPDATQIYAKVNIEALREVALGGEEIL